MHQGTKDFVDAGLLWLLEELPPLVRKARLEHKSNDIAFWVTMKGPEEADVFAGPREVLLRRLKEVFPACTETAGRLEQSIPPNKVFAVVFKDEDFFTLEVPLPDYIGPAGVLN